MLAVCFLRPLCKQEGGQEDDADDPRSDRDLFDLAREDRDDDVCDDTCADTLGNGVAEHHDDERHECDDRVGGVLPVHFDNGGHHQHAHPDERRSRCAARDELRDRA